MDSKDFKAAISGWIVSKLGTDAHAEGTVLRFFDVYDRLHEGIVHFWFLKTDGTLRSAYGTLVMDIIARHGGIPESDDSSRKNPRDTGVVSYYDLEKDAWRCFKADSIQEIDQEYGAS